MEKEKTRPCRGPECNGKLRPESDFYMSFNGDKDHYKSYCMQCASIKARKWREDNKKECLDCREKIVHSATRCRKCNNTRLSLKRRGDAPTSLEDPRWRIPNLGKYTGSVHLLYTDKKTGYTHHLTAHKWVMEQHLGRSLTKGERVIHKNGDKADNKIENLVLLHTPIPPTQAVKDKLKWCREFLDFYGEDKKI